MAKSEVPSASYRYAVKRDPKHRVTGRDKYLEGVAKGLLRPERRICHAMALPWDGKATNGWEGFPWLTMALGSGCLETPEETDMSPAGMAEGVRAEVASWGIWPDNGEAPDAIAARFTASLVQDRLGLPARDVPAGGPASPVSTIAARLALASALLTRFFHGARAASATALSRWDTDVASFDPAVEGDHPSTRFAREALVLPALEQLGAVKAELRQDPGSEVARAVVRLIDDLAAPLQGAYGAPYTLAIDQLRLLTEVTWHFLTRDRALYPGWSDLLLALLLTEGDEVIRGSGRPRPLVFNLKSLANVVSKLLDDPTTASWRARFQEGRVSEHANLFDGVADVLWAQADATSTQQSSVGLPTASAVVTSFDLELEIALWAASVAAAAAAEPGTAPRPFSVVVPMHVLEHELANEAEPCWFLAEIQPTDGTDAGLDLLRTPRHWRVVGAHLAQDDVKGQPIVVRLSGAPLLQVPNVIDLPPEELRRLHDLGIDVTPTTMLSPAVTIDEYLALRQSEAELFWASQAAGPAGASGRGRALPSWLTGSSVANPRFWMAIGVPVADGAIRNRIVSQITVRGMERAGEAQPSASGGSTLGPRAAAVPADDEDAAPSPPARSDVDGVAVNRRIDDDEAILLYWLGLDVVEDECVNFVGDFHHYADHVRHRGEGKRPVQDELCKVDGQARS